MRNRPRKTIKIAGLTLDITSSLNKFFLCECGRKYEVKNSLVNHVAKCNGIPVIHACRWCKLTFKTRGNLVRHAKFLHGDDSYQDVDTSKKKFQCNVCDSGYGAMWKLIHHIRRTHYNLVYGSPRFQTQQINQVWCETVINSNSLVKIKKTGPNTLIMTPMAPSKDVKLEHTAPNKIDLHSLYPTGRKRPTSKVTCKICKKSYLNRDLKKHTQEAHQMDFYRHKCNNCDRTFKRSYIYLKHVCFKEMSKRKVSGVVQYKKLNGITISNVTSLRPVEVD